MHRWDYILSHDLGEPWGCCRTFFVRLWLTKKIAQNRPEIRYGRNLSTLNCMCDRTLGNLQKAAFGRKPVKSRRSSYRGACYSRYPCENWEDVQVGLSVWGSMRLGHKLVQVEMTFVYSKMPREQALLPVSVCHVNIFTGYSIARSSRFA